MSTAYFVDFENVGETGLSGLEDLTPKDKIILFYSQTKFSIPVSHMVACIHANLKEEHFQIKKVAQNYLDFQLATYLGFYAAKHPKKKLVIVSKDNDFLPVVDFWTAKGRHIKKQETILGISLAAAKTDEQPPQPPRAKEALTEEAKEAIRTLLKDFKLVPNDYAVIYRALLKHSQDSAFRKELQQKIYRGKGREVGIRLADWHAHFWQIDPSVPRSIAINPAKQQSFLQLLQKVQSGQKNAFSQSEKKAIRSLLTGVPLDRARAFARIYLSIQHCTSVEEYAAVLQSVMPKSQWKSIYQKTESYFKHYHGIPS